MSLVRDCQNQHYDRNFSKNSSNPLTYRPELINPITDDHTELVKSDFKSKYLIQVYKRGLRAIGAVFH
ncbi:hypothetical protein IV203_023004 [Nitzschia inconspicua]|uniref:Uncharacterized protein n=1 Tax=Nitzschia inconspicua TaxID=303405 RepID=A0A9K3PB80_9STRA|nr:hypothetical protein IV203_023004 [Nitzschia inconspicua]